MSDVWGIVANNQETKRFRRGAKLWLMWTTGGGAHYGRAMFYGISPGGRRIECWAPFRRLENWRAAWVPENLRDRVMWFHDRVEAEGWAKGLSERE